ncbi:AraC family transcriptional regulator [Paenibacillus mesophilus]|uniref:AraC family transcriptional regulator n=1 Tax=Paenibacillus mesophilus TaxID=2582849 RepID=UPI0013053E65|nr:AraC family transcriptional regulator [Paenibacillus mesophilus]
MNSIHPVQHAIDYIEDHLSEPLELQHIAGVAFMSVPNLYRAFYALTGHPIKEYIRKRRISTSSWYLRYTDKPIIDVAIECGFDSYQTFTKIFKKLVGMTPGTYRKADVYYSFEAVNLLEHVAYMEDRGLSERHPDVKVIRFSPVQVATYRHQASKPDGIEEEAVRLLFALLERHGWVMERIRFYGTNVELPSLEKPFGYDIMIPLDETKTGLKLDDFQIGTFPGGLYAVGKSLDTDGSKIMAAWDRLLSEWLPRSTFALGEHPYIEEFLTYQGTVTRMKLYLPVKRKLERDTLETIIVERFTVYASRVHGFAAQKEADERLIAWMNRNRLTSRPGLQLFMSYSYGVELGEEFWYELALSVPNQREAVDRYVDGIAAKDLGGGLYVRLTSGAFGMMTGVLDRMYQWIYGSENYVLDESRQWFAEYLEGEGPDLERSASVRCYIPVLATAESV